jgi:outer membrane lipoprotein-sorting protein
MDRRRATLGAAAVGVAAGAVALALVASPAGAGQSPTLPSTTPDALVASVLTARLPAMSGTVQITNNLGLPSLPGLPQVATGNGEIRVWTDGSDRTRLAIPSPASEQTVVEDGRTLYVWNSADRTVAEHSLHNAAKTATGEAKAQDLDPATAAKDLVAAVGKTSTVSVDGTDMVANRPAYDLVLTPKPTERTLLREVRIAVDAQTRIPLQLTVLGENTNSPALRIGFSSLNIGPQDPSLFHFTVPSNATVVNGDNKDKHSAEIAGSTEPKLVGQGWDTVIVAQLPKASGANTDSMLGMVRQFGKAVHGTWGSGWLISTNIGNAVITSDGRVAAGFVPQQVLYQALGSGK